MKPGQRLIELAVEGDSLPTEFRLFAAGENSTTKGAVVFDVDAAVATMAAYEAHAVDLMIDLAHDSFDPFARANRDDADDARGWFRLEVRDGELWAAGVSWTPDGERRLRQRTQRYVSPAIRIDEQTNRVMEVYNVALCSMPATDGAIPLVARRQELSTMDPKILKEALDALEAGDQAKAMELVKAMIASAAGVDAGDMGDGDMGDGGEGLAETPDPQPADGEEDKGMSRQLTMLRRENAKLSREHSDTRKQLDELLAERAVAETEERYTLVGQLVTLGIEVPATAWEDPDADESKRRLAKRLRDEPVKDLRKRVALLRAAKPAGIEAPESVDADGLTAQQVRLAQTMTPAQAEAFRASIADRNQKVGAK